MAKKKTIVLGVTGSIAAYRACGMIELLRKDSFDVRVILTKEAGYFITPLTLQTLSHNRVVTDMFEPPEEWNPLHTSLADEAGLILIAPATANVIGKIANGICDDILTCVVMATKAPVLLAPAMNNKMYAHKVVQENIARLKRLGYHFANPVKGQLACGYKGIGHIADTHDIVSMAERLVR